MKEILLFFAILFSFNAQAQVTKVSLQASGLTCSMCSKSIFKSLEALDFVKEVEANIENSMFDISFKENSLVDLDAVKKKVEDAGFFVANFTATVHFDNVLIKNDVHAIVDGIAFHFLDVNSQVLNGDKIIRLIDKGFVSLKEYKRNKKFTKMNCYVTGVVESCCEKNLLEKGRRIFHVTI